MKWVIALLVTGFPASLALAQSVYVSGGSGVFVSSATGGSYVVNSIAMPRRNAMSAGIWGGDRFIRGVGAWLLTESDGTTIDTANAPVYSFDFPSVYMVGAGWMGRPTIDSGEIGRPLIDSGSIGRPGIDNTGQNIGSMGRPLIDTGIFGRPGIDAGITANRPIPKATLRPFKPRTPRARPTPLAKTRAPLAKPAGARAASKR